MVPVMSAISVCHQTDRTKNSREIIIDGWRHGGQTERLCKSSQTAVTNTCELSLSLETGIAAEFQHQQHPYPLPNTQQALVQAQSLE